MSSTRGRSNPSNKTSQSKKAGKSKQAPVGNKAGGISNQQGTCGGLYRCEACNKGYLRGLASLHIHQRHQCPVLTRSNLFHCDQCGRGIFRGKSSLDLHKRKLCTQAGRVAFMPVVEGAGGSPYEEEWEDEEEEGEDNEEEREEDNEEEREEDNEEEEGEEVDDDNGGDNTNY